MKKCLLVLALGIALTGAVFAGGGKEGASGTELYVFISQPEYADSIRALITEYKKVVPDVTINYETTQADYPALLKTKLNSGDLPDIFTSTAGAEIDLYTEYSLNLADQPIAKAMIPAVADGFKSMDTGAGPYGFAIKGNFFGILYNKDIFAKAGIAEFPQTLDALEAACEKIAALGIKPFTSGFGEWWVWKHAAMNFFGTATNDPIALTKKFENGQAKVSDYPRLYNDFFRFVDLVKKYGDDKLLETTLDREVAAFGNGQAAMTVGQGAWIEEDVLKINPNLKIGFDGYPISNNPADCKVVTGADQAMRVSNKSKHQKELLDFVNWWYTSDYGKGWFANVAKVVPPISAGVVPNLEVPKQGAAHVAQEGSAPLSIIYSTDAFHQVFGELMQAYVGGSATKDQTCAAIERQWISIH
ncbi:ABC transporter substrate-binding protein [Treponema primitia]|uniref:ABC transporter substrate-binding protein n=1 Tax=Treponema primitia TaxID=88058 RepID=UPI00025552D4|nr:extracellular solute-binding protein [Treponema primitia]